LLLELLHWLGYGVCHQIPERTIHLAGEALPLCARCSGIYVGAAAGFLFMIAARRGRSSIMPPPKVLAVLLVFVLAFAVDGVNSYLSFFPGAPHLYEPQNWLRFTTGILHGMAISFVVLPVFNFTFWKESSLTPVVTGLRELAALTGLCLVIVVLANAGLDPLLYPLALVSSAGLLAMFALLNGAILLIVLRRENRGTGSRSLALVLGAGMLMGLLEIAALDAGRLWLTAVAGLPF
jgi:uncharacterized membrane protein